MTHERRLIAEFRVDGRPRPGGSKTAMPVRRGKNGPLVFSGPPTIRGGAVFGRPIINVVDGGGENLKTWRAAVAAAASAAYRRRPVSGAVSMDVSFYMPRPKDHFRADQVTLRAGAPEFHLGKPDRTKLLRALEDALTGILWRDDTVVVAGPVSKDYATPAHPPGAEVAAYLLLPRQGSLLA